MFVLFAVDMCLDDSMWPKQKHTINFLAASKLGLTMEHAQNALNAICPHQKKILEYCL